MPLCNTKAKPPPVLPFLTVLWDEKFMGGRCEGVLLSSGLIHVSVTQHISSLLSLMKWWNVGILLQMEWAFTNAHLSRVVLQNDACLSLVGCFSRFSCTPVPLLLRKLCIHVKPVSYAFLDAMYLVENPGSSSGLPMPHRFPPNSQCNNFGLHL